MTRELEDLVTAIECSDAGSGDPRESFWQFFVGPVAVQTKNPHIVDIVKLAIETCRTIRVVVNDSGQVSQARIELQYK